MYFTDSDFDLYQQHFQNDVAWNSRRLEVRQKLQGIGDEVCRVFSRHGINLDRRESLHHPHRTNGKRVRRQRTMIFRDRKSRKSLQSFLGKELGKDLDSAVNNVHFQVGLDHEKSYWGLRIDSGAWYDLNVLLKRAEEGDGRQGLEDSCRASSKFNLILNRSGARIFSGMSARDWRDLSGTLRPGESSLEVIRTMPRGEVVACGDDFFGIVVDDVLDLRDFYRLSCWTLDSPSGMSL